jgi:hypothetical protein
METFQFKQTTFRTLSENPWNIRPGRASCLKVLSDHPKMTFELLRAACRPLPEVPGYSSGTLGLNAIAGKAPQSSFAPGKPPALPFKAPEDAFPVSANRLPGTSKLLKSSSKTDGLPSCPTQAAHKAWSVHSKSPFECSRIPKIPIAFKQSPCRDPSKP